MIKVYAMINNRRTLVLGLSRLNMERLLDDKPIPVDVQAFLADIPPGLGETVRGDRVQDIFIVGGETEDTIKAQLSLYLPMPEGTS